MKPNFCDTPEAWLRASRTGDTRAQYANPFHGHSREPLFTGAEKVTVILAIVVTVAACLGVFAV